MNAVESLKVWHTKVLEPNKNKFDELIIEESGRGSISIQCFNESICFDICAWDHAWCLDVGFLNANTEDSLYPMVGSCEGYDEFLKKLETVKIFLEEQSYLPTFESVQKYFANKALHRTPTSGASEL